MTHSLSLICFASMALSMAYAEPTSQPCEVARALRLTSAQFSLSISTPEARKLSVSFDDAAAEEAQPSLPSLNLYLPDEDLVDVLTTHARRALRLEVKVRGIRHGAREGCDAVEVEGVTFLDERRPIAAGRLSPKLDLQVRLGRLQGPGLSEALLERVEALALGCWVALASDHQRPRVNGALILAIREGHEASAARVAVDGLVYPRLTRCILDGLRRGARSALRGPPTLLPLYLRARPTPR